MDRSTLKKSSLNSGPNINKVLLAIICCFLLMSPLIGNADENPFITKKAPEKKIAPPTVFAPIYNGITLLQHALNRELTHRIKELKGNRANRTLASLVFISFLYGLIHAAGPGHGKVVMFSYFLSQKGQVQKGLILGNLIAFFHALSGVVIVSVIYFVLKSSYLLPIEAITKKLMVISYSLITILGLVFLTKNLFGLGIKSPTEKIVNPLPTKRSILPIAIAVGMVPCPGIIIIMLFTLSLDLFFTGVFLSFSMALGMAITISLAGILSIIGQKGVLKALIKNNRTTVFIQKGFSIIGSALIILLGIVLLIDAI